MPMPDVFDPAALNQMRQCVKQPIDFISLAAGRPWQ
jgi:hypothetical protein